MEKQRYELDDKHGFGEFQTLCQNLQEIQMFLNNLQASDSNECKDIHENLSKYTEQFTKYDA